MVDRERELKEPSITNQEDTANYVNEILLGGAKQGAKMIVIAGGGYALVDSLTKNPLVSRRRFLISCVEFIVGNTIVMKAADNIK